MALDRLFIFLPRQLVEAKVACLALSLEQLISQGRQLLLLATGFRFEVLLMPQEEGLFFLGAHFVFFVQQLKRPLVRADKEIVRELLCVGIWLCD